MSHNENGTGGGGLANFVNSHSSRRPTTTSQLNVFNRVSRVLDELVFDSVSPFDFESVNGHAIKVVFSFSVKGFIPYCIFLVEKAFSLDCNEVVLIFVDYHDFKRASSLIGTHDLPVRVFCVRKLHKVKSYISSPITTLFGGVDEVLKSCFVFNSADYLVHVDFAKLENVRYDVLDLNMFQSGIHVVKDYLIKKFDFWVREPLYLMFEVSEGDRYYRVFSKASKRGNDVFTRRNLARILRIRSLIKKLDDTYFVHPVDANSFASRSFLISLTLNRDIFTKLVEFIKNKKSASLFEKDEQFLRLVRDEKLIKILSTIISKFPESHDVRLAWESMSYLFDLFKKRLERRLGVEFFCLRGAFEIHSDGYPHLHLILIFPCDFHVFPKFSMKEKKEVWRLENKIRDVFKSCWEFGFLDVRAIEDKSECADYVVKYAIKPYRVDSSDKERFCLAFNWLFRKHSFTTSRLNLLIDFAYNSKQSVDDDRLDTSKQNSPVQIDFDVSVVLVGFVVINSRESGKPPPMIFTLPCEHEFVKLVDCMLYGGSGYV